MKENILDFVFYDGNLSLIDLRINLNSKFSPSIFLITQSKFFSQLSSVTNKYSKIQVIVDDEDINNRTYYSKLIKNKISENYKDFSDVVFISQNNEIPNIEQIDFKNYDLTTSNLLFHKIYEYSLDYRRKYLEYGCGMITFSHILQNPNFLGTLSNFKEKLPPFISYVDEGITIKNYGVDSEKRETYTCPYSKIKVPLNHT